MSVGEEHVARLRGAGENVRASALERYLDPMRRWDPTDGWVRSTLRALGLDVDGAAAARLARLGIPVGRNLEKDDDKDGGGR